MGKTIKANGISIEFPFEPYECQTAYMEKVIECLKTEKNGILESPTGTGKTLCLLCSTLAFLETKKAQIQSNQFANRPEAGGSLMMDRLEGKAKLGAELDDAVGPWRGEIASPRIIYASRTHSQLTQAVQELKRTSYSANVRVCVLGSREQLCIHEQVSKEENNATKVHLCRAKVTARTCHFYNNVEKFKDVFSQGVMDIEDMVRQGTKAKCCPYYMAREMKSDADIIFLPYNYLVDPKSRRAHGIELNNNIVIFDEAHNLEKICEDSVSFDWTTSEIAAAIRDLGELSDKLAALVADEDNNVNAFDMDPDTKALPDFHMGQVLSLKTMLHRIEGLLDEVQIKKPEGVPKPGDFLYELLEKADLRFSNKDEYIDILDKMVQFLTTDVSNVFSRKGAGLTKFADVVKIAFSRSPTNEYTPTSHHQKTISRHYKVFVKEMQKDKKKKKAGWDAEPASEKSGRMLSYWCFSPGAAMEELKAQGVKCIILTSGTLSPMSSFKTEMGIPFEVELENSHVIEPKQVWIGVVGRGPDGTTLSSAYETRFKIDYQKSLGNAMVNFARVVPHGLLLFFPSYPVMDKCLESWTSENIWNRVEQYKPIFIEPKRKHDFLTAMDNFYGKVRDPTANGAVFAAVCRGKVSEGLDFSDNNGRAVVILGLPFPPRMDPKVVLKMEYLDETRRKGGKGLSGREWYRQQASRAVNQAIGRVIRHKQDYGAIILCDTRFSSKDSIEQLPKWVKPYITVYPNFGLAMKELMVFFKKAEQNLPAPQRPKQRISAEPGCSGAYFEPTVKSRARPDVSNLQGSGVVASHVPSLRPCQESAMSLKRLTLQYEGGPSAQAEEGRGFFDTLESQTAKTIDFNKVTSPEGFESVFKQPAGIPPSKARKKIVLKSNNRPSLSENTSQRQSSSSDVQSKLKASTVPKQNEDMVSTYLKQVKAALSQDSYSSFSAMLGRYNKDADFDSMVSGLADFFIENPTNHHLFRTFYRFVKTNQKARFDETCLALTGQGCGHSARVAAKKRSLTNGSSHSGTAKKMKCDSNKTEGHRNLKEVTSSEMNEFPANGSTLKSNSGSTSIIKSRVMESTSFNNTQQQTTNSKSKDCDSKQKCKENETDSRSIIMDNSSKSASNPAEKNHPVASASRSSEGKNEPEASQNDKESRCRASLEKVLQHGESHGLTCCKCSKSAKLPMQALCGHVCCIECWKVVIVEERHCPTCKTKVKRKHLKRLT